MKLKACFGSACSLAVRALMIAILLLTLSSLSYSWLAHAASDPFKPLSLSVKPQEGSRVYPGSRNVLIIVNLEYNGGQDAKIVSACLNLPSGFTPSRGFTSCSPPYTPNGSIYDVVKPGSLLEFEYHIDIDRGVAPGAYTLPVNIEYYLVSGSDTLEGPYRYSFNIEVNVSSYPEVRLEVVDAYLQPYGYPGSTSTLNIVFYNNNTVDVTGGLLEIELPQGITPTQQRISLPPIPAGSMRTVSVEVTLDPSITPGTYKGRFQGNVTATTEDNVQYEAKVSGTFTFTVNPPPTNIVDIVDSGITQAPPVGGSGTRLYLTLQVVNPSATVTSIVARWRIISGGVFINESSSGLAYVSGVYSYGSLATILSPPIRILQGARSILAEVELDILASINGNSFWVTRTETIQVNLPEYMPAISVASVYWGNGIAYPGSKDLTLNVVIENNDVITVRSLSAELILPKGFYPAKLEAAVQHPIQPYTHALLSFSGISIDPKVQPGTYVAMLAVNYTIELSDGSYTNISVTYKVAVNVSTPLDNPLKLVDLHIGGLSSPVEGMAKASLNIALQVVKPVTIRALHVTILAQPPLRIYGANNASVYGEYRYGSIINLRIPQVAVSGSSTSTTIVVIVKGLASINGAEYWFTQLIERRLNIQPAQLNMSIVEYGVTPEAGSPGYLFGGRIYLEILSLNPYTVDEVIANVCLQNARYVSGLQCKTVVVRQPIQYGTVVSIEVGGVEIQNLSSPLQVLVKLSALVNTGEAVYIADRSFKLNITLRRELKPLRLCCSETLYNGNPAPLLPGQRNVELRVRLVNYAPYTITSIDVKNVSLPDGFNLSAISGSCLTGVAPGSSCTLTLILDTSSRLNPGAYKVNVTLSAVASINGAITSYEENITIPVAVANTTNYTPQVRVLSAYWGQEPSIAYQLTGVTTLTIVLYNPGRWSVNGVYGELEPENRTVSIISPASYCANILEPGSACRLSFRVSLENVTAGRLGFKLQVKYLVRIFGVNWIIERSYNVSLPVYRFTGRSNLILVGAGWLNGWHVYPNTDNATFTVKLANQNPYPIAGIYAELLLPKAFGWDGERVVTYVDGPIQPLQSFTLRFNLHIGNVSPGVYTARLVVRYVPQVAGVTSERLSFFTVRLKVYNISSDIELVTVAWQNGAPTSDAKGAVLLVVFRNVGVDAIRAPVARIVTPEGVTCSINNSTVAYLPLFPLQQQELQSTAIPQGELAKVAEIVSQIAREETPYQLLGKGTLFKVAIPLNLYLGYPKRFNITIGLSFIDQWGSKRYVEYKVEVPPYGSVKLFKIHVPSIVRFYNGVGMVNMSIVNIGDAPIYNVYIYVLPKSPLVSISDNIFYVDELKPLDSLKLNFTLYYNPASLEYFGGSAGEYSSIQMVAAIVFKDYTGVTHNVNMTFSLKAASFIDLRLGSDVKAEYRNGVVYAGGTLENHGISKAYSVAVYLVYGNRTASSFLGDIDAGSQTAFRVEMPVKEPPSYVNLKVVYRDAYGGIHSFAQKIPVVVTSIANTTTSTSHARGGLLGGYVAVIVGVSLFLALAGLMIYRLVRKHEKKLGG